MKTKRLAVVGLGYVGLPLAVEFGKSAIGPIIGFDINAQKIQELSNTYDAMGELSTEELAATQIDYTTDPTKLKEADCIIVAVPTPVTKAKQPNLRPLEQVSETIGAHLKPGVIIVFESTVYPGVTEEVCIPIIERVSGLIWKKDFFVGYSPERINPGDKEHTLEKIIKIVAGDTADTLDELAAVYELVCKAGIHRASSIKVAEAAKVIENIQRDLNIALVNELSIIFNKIGISTNEVLEAAGTKWNFNKFAPGLVGGHCIGVDPYYLVHKSEELGYHPQVITAGRRINDSMAGYVADRTIEALIQAGKLVQGAKVLVVGLTFKENVKDIRNSKIIDTIQRLQRFGVDVYAHDPILTEEQIKVFTPFIVPDVHDMPKCDAVILYSVHDELRDLHLKDYMSLCKDKPAIIDIKNKFAEEVPDDLIYFAL